MTDDVPPKVVDTEMQVPEVTEANAIHVEEYPDGSRILVGPVRTIEDPEHGTCLQVVYQPVGWDGCDAYESLQAYKEAGDKALHEMAMELHGDLQRIRDESPDAFARMTEPTITVCSACLCASCWQGAFYCDEAKTAGTVQKTRAQLEALGRESPHYWEAAKA